MAGRRRGAATARIHTYDRFVWEPWMSDFAAAAGRPMPYRVGDDFRPALLEALGRHRPLVDVHTADLTTERWTGGAIELLVVDAMKSWTLAGNILREFATAVASGGVVFHQDFAHYYTPWIHLIGYRLRDHLDVYYDVPRSGGVAFRVRRALEEAVVAGLADPDTYGPEDVTEACAYSRSLVGPGKRASIPAAEAMFYVHAGDLERAEHIIALARERDLEGDLPLAERSLRDAQLDTARAGE